MIQFNLLPDVKIEYIRTQRTKRMVVGVSLLASAAALVVLIFLLLTVHVFQKKNINDLSNDIQVSSKELKQTPNLTKMLTVQSQLKSLTGLHDGKPTTARLFTFMNQLTPTTVSIEQLKLDLDAQTLTISGKAPELANVNAFVDALKYTTYQVSGQEDTPHAFKQVVMSDFDRDEKSATFTISSSIDTAIFTNTSDVTLIINNAAAATTSSVIFKR